MIDKDTIIKLAREAGAARFYPETQATKPDAYVVGQEFLERFAQAAYKLGLEDAAKVCDQKKDLIFRELDGLEVNLSNLMLRQVAILGHETDATAIRALGEQHE